MGPLAISFLFIFYYFLFVKFPPDHDSRIFFVLACVLPLLSLTQFMEPSNLVSFFPYLAHIPPTILLAIRPILLSALPFLLAFVVFEDMPHFVLNMAYLIFDYRAARNSRQYRRRWPWEAKLLHGCTGFNKLYSTYWNHPELLEQMHDEHCFYLDDVGRRLTSLFFPSNRIYLRKCYKELWSYLESVTREEPRKGGALVTGSPGVGKSFSLPYILIRRLMQCKTTIYCTNIGEIYLFDNRGVWCLNFVPKVEELVIAEKDDFVWCLYDGEDPPSIGYCLETCFLVHTASPKAKRYHEWTKKAGARAWYMNVWDRREFHEWYRLRGNDIDDETLTNHIEEFGLCPRDHVYRDIYTRAMAAMARLVLNPASWHQVVDAISEGNDHTLSHKIFAIIASQDHLSFRVDFKTPTMRTLLMEMHNIAEEERFRNLYHQLFSMPQACTLCGWMFECYVIRQTSIRNSSSVRSCYPMTRVGAAREFVWDPKAPTLFHQFPLRDRTAIFENRKKTFDFTTDFKDVGVSKYYYVPTARNNPLFDAFFFDLENGTLIMRILQISTNATDKKAGGTSGYSIINDIAIAARQTIVSGSPVARRVKFEYVFVVPGAAMGQEVHFQLPTDDEKHKWNEGTIYVLFVDI